MEQVQRYSFKGFLKSSLLGMFIDLREREGGRGGGGREREREVRSLSHVPGRGAEPTTFCCYRMTPTN